MSLKILIIEDDPLQQQIFSQLLEKMGYATIVADSGYKGLEILAKNPAVQLVLLDFLLPDINGMGVLNALGERNPDLPVIMLTSKNDTDLAVAAIKAGASDFLGKPPEKERLQVAIENALKTSLLKKEVVRLRRQHENVFTFENLVGCDRGLAMVIRIARKAASSDIPVLLTGETGTGKEVFARAIHGESRRVGRPFVAVNCGAIPAQLVESTLFGHEKGAFTGAIEKSTGRFREAEGGTIFLDEIGDLPADAQVKLLRVLQQKEITPVGAARAVPVNVRVISATNRDVEKDVAAGRFRSDLYFRLNVLSIHLPSLRAREDDVPHLVRHFIERFSASESRSLKDITPRALDMLCRRSWPGNVRELENIIFRAVVLCEKDTLDIIDFSSLSVDVPARENRKYFPAFLDSSGNLLPLAEIELAVLQFSLDHYNGNVTQAAHALGIAKSTFYRRVGRRKTSGS